MTTTGIPTAAITESGSLPSGVTFTDNGDGTATLAGTPAPGTERQLPDHDHRVERGQPGRHAELHADREHGPDGPGHHQRAARPTFTVGTPGVVHGDHHRQPGRGSSARAGALPSGVTFTDNGDGTATLAGTPAAGTSGSYPLTITASNGVSPDATQNFTLTVNPSPTRPGHHQRRRRPRSPPGQPGNVHGGHHRLPDARLSATSSPALPSGVTLQRQRQRHRHPGRHAAGRQPGHLRADHHGHQLGGHGHPELRPDREQRAGHHQRRTGHGDRGQAFSFTVTTTGSPAPTLTRAGTLPTGVTFNDNGNGTATLAGTPAATARAATR